MSRSARAEWLQQRALTFIEAAPLLRGRLKTMRIRLFGGGYGVAGAKALAGLLLCLPSQPDLGPPGCSPTQDAVVVEIVPSVPCR